MKHYLRNKFKHASLTSATAILLMVTLFSSCLKDPGTDASSIVSALSVINASPDSPDLEFVLDNKRVQKFSYPDIRINYFPVFLGYHLARIYEADKFYLPLYELELNLSQGKFYAIYIAGKREALTSITVEDDLNMPSDGHAKLRFIHLSPDTPSLDFFIDSDNILASNKKFKEYSSFQEIKAGNYNAIIKSNEGTSVNLTLDLKLQDGKIYTLWVMGLMETDLEEEELGYSLFTHNTE